MYQVLALGFMRLHVDYMQNKGRVELSWHSWRAHPTQCIVLGSTQGKESVRRSFRLPSRHRVEWATGTLSGCHLSYTAGQLLSTPAGVLHGPLLQWVWSCSTALGGCYTTKSSHQSCRHLHEISWADVRIHHACIYRPWTLHHRRRDGLTQDSSHSSQLSVYSSALTVPQEVLGYTGWGRLRGLSTSAAMGKPQSILGTDLPALGSQALLSITPHPC